MSDPNLPDPVEFLELQDNQTVVIQPLKKDLKKREIHNRALPPGVMKEISVLRIYYKKQAAVPGPDYYDISSQHLIMQLWPILDNVIRAKKSLKITAVGSRQQKRFMVAIV